MKNERSGTSEIDAKEELHSGMGICPLCGSTDLDYGVSIPQDSMLLYPLECNDCHATFSEIYEVMYNCKSEIEDSNGNEVPRFVE